MKNYKRLIACFVAITVFAGGFLFTTPTAALAATTDSMENYAPGADDAQEETDNTNIKDQYIEYNTKPAVKTVNKLEKWYNVCTSVGRTLKKKRFHYSNGGCKSTLAKGIRSGRKCNCALYVSWCLQEYGAISKGKTFYVKGSGRLSKSLGSKVRVIRVYKKAKNAGLKPGDIVCFTTPHACIYAGKSKNGNRLWFDQGKIATYGNSNGARYKSYGKRQEGYLNNRTVSYIIRIKDL